MKKVERKDILDFQTYSDQRDTRRRKIMLEKDVRRIHLGAHLTFLFETTGTMLYQIQEMMRLEQMVRGADIEREMAAYNALLGDDGELGCSLLIEIEDEAQRDATLRSWMNLLEHLHIDLEDGTSISPTWDPTQVGEDRLSAVQYLKFPVNDGTPVALTSTHPEYREKHVLTPDEKTALLSDR